MKKKEEILEVFDISAVISVTQRDIFRGMAALTEVLCDIRDIFHGMLMDMKSD